METNSDTVRITIMGTFPVLPPVVEDEDKEIDEDEDAAQKINIKVAGGQSVMVEVDDVGGQGVQEQSIKWCDGIVYVYNVCDRQSFEQVWYVHRSLCEMKEVSGQELPFLLLGSTRDEGLKPDNREVASEEGKILANRLETTFFEFSPQKEPGRVAEVLITMHRKVVALWRRLMEEGAETPRSPTTPKHPHFKGKGSIKGKKR